MRGLLDVAETQLDVPDNASKPMRIKKHTGKPPTKQQMQAMVNESTHESAGRKKMPKG